MNIPLIAADLSSIQSQLPSLQVVLTMGVGIVAGLGVVGVVHYFIRPRLSAAKTQQRPTPETHDPFVYGSAYEQRSSFRREGNPVEARLVDIASGNALSNAFVVDRSVGGLGLLAQEAIEPEKHLNVRPTNAPGITPWVEIVVKSCRPCPQGFELGCQFVRTPPWAILLMFG